MKPIIVLDVGDLLGRNDEHDYIERVLLMANTLARFLEENALLERKVLNTDGKIGKDEKIAEDDLTDEGLALFWGLFIERWLSSHDRGTKIENVQRLEKGLSEIRKVGVRELLKSTRYYTYHADKNPD